MIEEKLITSGITSIAGVDEAGRGACAGPLVVSAVILRNPLDRGLSEVKDSKELSPREREELFDVIIKHSTNYAIIEISSDEIDEIGLHRSNLDGMRFQ